MDDFFNKTDVYGILSTADASGRVDAAYARPYLVDQTSVAFVTLKRPPHATLREPPILFIFLSERNPATKGIVSFSSKFGKNRLKNR